MKTLNEARQNFRKLCAHIIDIVAEEGSIEGACDNCYSNRDLYFEPAITEAEIFDFLKANTSVFLDLIEAEDKLADELIHDERN